MRPPFAPEYGTASPVSRRALSLKLKRYTAFELAHALDLAARQAPTRRERRWLSQQANRLHACAATLHFRLDTPPDGETVLYITHKRCCHKAAVCPICASYRSRRMRRKYKDYLAAVLGAGNVPVFVMLTCTVPNAPIEALKDQLALLDGAYAKLVRLTLIKRVLIGTLVASEITVPLKNGQHEAHSHIHAIWALRADYFDRDKQFYLSQEQLQTLWSRCAGAPAGQEYLVHIKRIRSRDGAVNGDAVIGALSELIKYQTKVVDLLRPDTAGRYTADPTVIATIAKATHKRRALRATGFFLKPPKVSAARPDCSRATSTNENDPCK